ncbi:MAG: AAA family ATPase [Candidatus Aenigmarchaeota archaeon]|nr:AAA family ATPase [Candidatus Aenigmarchaeota archaeon]
MVSVIGIVGPIGSGKDTAADYIAEKYGYTIFSFRDAVREVAEKEGLEPDRENMQKVSREYRDKYGEQVFAQIILEKIRASKCEKALVKELRTSGDVKTIWNSFKTEMKIIKVVMPARLRFERMKSRGRPGDPITLEEFNQQEKREEELGYTKAFNFTDFIIFNTGTKEELYEQVDKAMKSLKEDKTLVRKRFF